MSTNYYYQIVIINYTVVSCTCQVRLAETFGKPEAIGRPRAAGLVPFTVGTAEDHVFDHLFPEADQVTVEEFTAMVLSSFSGIVPSVTLSFE